MRLRAISARSITGPPPRELEEAASRLPDAKGFEEGRMPG
jgi:hypothetical protein